MSFNRRKYKETFDFAEMVYLHSRKPEIKRFAQILMIDVEDVIGQQRSNEKRSRLGLGGKPREIIR